MAGYTKLFSSIVASTIWRESKETKVVWITLLAMANREGRVDTSVPGLADMARVTIEECVSAVSVLSSPDSWSRSKEFEGRRIEAVDGGFVILNYVKYRENRDPEIRRKQNRESQARFREANKPKVSHNKPRISRDKPESAHADAEADNTIHTSATAEQTQPEHPLIALWNSQSRLPAIRQLSAARLKTLKTRSADDFFSANWSLAIEKLNASDFATGNSGNGNTWRANIDWFLKPDSVLKIVEGKYDNQTGARDPHYVEAK